MYLFIFSIQVLSVGFFFATSTYIITTLSFIHISYAIINKRFSVSFVIRGQQTWIEGIPFSDRNYNQGKLKNGKR